MQLDNPLADARTRAAQMLETVIREAAHLIEVEEFRSGLVMDQTTLLPTIEARWKQRLIEETEAGDESDPMPTPEEFQAKLTKAVFDELSASATYLHASGLVLAHSIFDVLLTDLLRVTSIADPSVWLPLVGQRAVKLAAVREDGLASLENQAIGSLVEELGRESIEKRLKKLLLVCSSVWAKSGHPEKFNPHRLPEYTYDEALLLAIDARRQGVVHQKAISISLQDTIHEDAAAMWQGTVNFALLLADCFSLPLDIGQSIQTRFAERKMALIFQTGKPSDTSAQANDEREG